MGYCGLNISCLEFLKTLAKEASFIVDNIMEQFAIESCKAATLSAFKYLLFFKFIIIVCVQVYVCCNNVCCNYVMCVILCMFIRASLKISIC